LAIPQDVTLIRMDLHHFHQFRDALGTGIIHVADIPVVWNIVWNATAAFIAVIISLLLESPASLNGPYCTSPAGVRTATYSWVI